MDALVVGMTDVDFMVVSMAKIKAMLHKRHGHFEVDTYTNPLTL